MWIGEFITQERVAYRPQATSKKRALELASSLIARAHPSLVEKGIFDCLLARERLGSTGIGHGIAIPHGRLKNIDRAVGAFVRLDQGVNFDAVDAKPVDLVCALIVPAESTDEHLQLLAMLASMFSDQGLRERLRRAVNAAELYATLIDYDGGLPLKQAGVPAHRA
jgi:nitrogen PTS system EIIA component